MTATLWDNTGTNIDEMSVVANSEKEAVIIILTGMIVKQFQGNSPPLITVTKSY